MKKVYSFLFILIVIVYYLFSNKIEDFTPIEVLTNYNDLKTTIRIFKTFSKFLKDKKIEYWAIGGTLLGAVRDKGMISWDDDADISMKQEYVQKLLKYENELKRMNIGLVEWFGGYKAFDINGKNIEGKDFKYPFIDIFTMVKGNDNDYIYEAEFTRSLWDDHYKIDELFPLKETIFEDYYIYIPNNPIPFIDHTFKDWKTKALKTYDHVTHTKFNKTEFALDYDMNKKPYLWVFWDGFEPEYIKLCYKTLVKHCSNSFNIVRLNQTNIYDYLPELKDKNMVGDMSKLIIQHKVDIYRIMLLYKYGGLYLDADIIVLKDLSTIMDKLKKYDFVGFGCNGFPCTKFYGNPSNWMLCSRPNTMLMGNILTRQLNKVKNNEKIEYHDIGKILIWEELDKLITKQDYEYYHYNPKFDGSRDINGDWISSDIVFSNKKIEYKNENDMLVFVFYNSSIPDGINLKNMSEKELLSKDWNYTKFIKKALQ